MNMITTCLIIFSDYLNFLCLFLFGFFLENFIWALGRRKDKIMGKNLCECFGHGKTPTTLNFHIEKEYKFLFEKNSKSFSTALWRSTVVECFYWKWLIMKHFEINIEPNIIILFFTQLLIYNIITKHSQRHP